jgi:hypothetical protein
MLGGIRGGRDEGGVQWAAGGGADDLGAPEFGSAIFGLRAFRGAEARQIIS